MALGEYPVVSLAEARERYFAARKMLVIGIDPMAERKAEDETWQREAENSFENIARKWWEWWAIGKSSRHADHVLRRLEADVLPAFGHKFIDAVTAADIRELMLAIESRGASDVAKRAHETTGQIFRYALPTEWLPEMLLLISSPAISWPKVNQRTLHASMPKNCPLCS
jgi:hypothetical protein